MTNHSVSTGQNGSEGDSEQKKWGQKRQQFDAVVSTARFNGAIDNLANGTVDVRTLTGILDELNGVQGQRGRYMAEILALKIESRRLATVPFHHHIAEFLIEGSRRIPWLSDGLASQLAVALASAADNPAYLDTVNTAVGNLLLDVTRPLKPDTRNFLRALTDKIDATRRLQEARGHLAIVPSTYPSVIPQQLANATSPEPAPTAPRSDRLSPPAGFDEGERDTSPLDEQRVHAAGAPVSSSAGELVEQSEARLGSAPGPTQQRSSKTQATDPAIAGGEPSHARAGLEGVFMTAAELVAGQAPGAVHPKAPTPPSERVKAAPKVIDALQPSLSSGKTAPGIGASPSVGKTAPGVKASPSVGKPASELGAVTSAASATSELGAVTSAASAASGLDAAPTMKSVPPDSADTDDDADWDDLDQDELKTEKLKALSISRKAAKRSTRGIPAWILVVAAGGIIAAGVGVWFLTRENGSSDKAPTASASAAHSAAPAASAKKAKKAREKKPPAAVPPQAAPPTPQAAPLAPQAAPLAPQAAPPAPQAAPPPPPAAVSTPAPSPPPAAKITPAPIVRTPPVVPSPAPKPAVRSTSTSKPTTRAEPAPPKPSVTKPESPKPAPKATAEAPITEAPASPSTPKPSRTIDDIIVELLQVPNDPASIESKAHEVSRIVARSARNDAEIILRRLIPEDVLSGTETVDTRTLEPVRRVVALLLKKVALDKDDNRAALAIDALGEWAKLRQHGAAAKLTLDQLAEEPVVLSRPKRLRAIERVQARLGISNVGE